MKKYLMVLFIILVYSSMPAQEWIQQNSPTTKWIKSIFFINKNIGWIIVQKDSIYKTTDEGNTWYGKYCDTNDYSSIMFIDEKRGWIAGNYGSIIKTVDGGDTWTKYINDTEYDLNCMVFNNSNTGWVGGEGNSFSGTNKGILLKTTNAGNLWFKISDSTIHPVYSICFINSSDGWISGISDNSDLFSDGFIFNTTDGGLKWNSRKYQGFGLKNIIFIDRNIGYTNGIMSKSIRTTDGGISWSNFQPKKILGLAYIGLRVIDTNKIFMADYESIFYTKDAGKTWNEKIIGIYGSNIISGFHILDTVNGWCSTTKGNLWKMIALPNKVIYTKNTNSKDIEINCYPNPVNPETKIEYDLPYNSRVNIQVYDYLGRKINVLKDEYQHSGKYSVVFNGKGMASGVYYVLLKTEKELLTEKILLLK